jgi:hypothetical protein
MSELIKWFAVQIDRDFHTGKYGGGIQFFKNLDEPIIITGESYDNGILKVKDEKGNIIILDNEPDNESFEYSLLEMWKIWDGIYGCYDSENRSDYEPWAFNSKEALAINFGLSNDIKEIQTYYKKNL